MNIYRSEKFEIIANGERSGFPTKWKQTPLTVDSLWDAGSDGEKFEVLAAIRRTYNPDNKNDIRGSEGQTPAQIGRTEGFSELKYRRTASTASEVTIVSTVTPYLRLVPTPDPRITVYRRS